MQKSKAEGNPGSPRLTVWLARAVVGEQWGKDVFGEDVEDGGCPDIAGMAQWEGEGERKQARTAWALAVLYVRSFARTHRCSLQC